MIAVGIILTIAGLYFFYDYARFLRNTAKVHGHIVMVEAKRGPKGMTTYCPIATFKAGGSDFVTPEMAYTNLRAPKVGDSVTVIYKTAEPRTSRIYLWPTFHLPLLFVMIGPVILLLAALWH